MTERESIPERQDREGDRGSSGEEGDVKDCELVTVFRGSMSQVMSAQCALEGMGIRTFVLDAFMKTIDPFITGGINFEVSLQVSAKDVPRVRGVLESKEKAPWQSEEEEEEEQDKHGADDGSDDENTEASASPEEPPGGTKADAEAPFGSVEEVGRKVRWASCLGFTAPMGLVLGIEYLRRARAMIRRPPQHGLTVAAFWLNVLWVAILLFGLLYLVEICLFPNR